MKDKYISIITVVWNAREEIKNTIESIIPFLNDVVELVVVDGGSSDGTLELLKCYENNNVVVFSEKDNGIYDAMNKGAKLAQGEWFIYINAGDRLQFLPHQLDSTADAICFAVKTEECVISPTYDWRLRLHNTLPHQGLFYRKSSFTGFDDKLRFFADYDYNLKLLSKKALIYTSRDIVSFHSLLGVSNSASARDELKVVLKRNGGLFWYSLSFFYFKYKGLIKRIKKIL